MRYPSYSNGRIAFTYLGDIWTADENGQNIQRLTVNKARDAYPRFSPDGKWIAFSSDRNGNLDVFLIPAGGGTAKQLTAIRLTTRSWVGRPTGAECCSAVNAAKTLWQSFTW